MDNIDTDDEKITKESLFHLYVRTLVNRSLSVNKEKAKEKKRWKKHHHNKRTRVSTVSYTYFEFLVSPT